MGFGNVLGRIGRAMAPQMAHANAMTPPFLPPSDGTDLTYDEFGNVIPSPSSAASQLGSIGAQPPPKQSAPRLADSVGSGVSPQAQPIPPAAPNTPGGQKIGLGRQIGGALIQGAGMLFPPTIGVTQALGERVAQGKFPAQEREYERQMGVQAEQTKTGKVAAETEEAKQRGKYYGQQAATMAEEGKMAPKGSYIPFGTGGIFDASAGKVVVEPTAKNAADYIEIDPEKGKALGLSPDPIDGKVRIPKEGIGPYLTGQLKPAPKERKLEIKDETNEITGTVTRRWYDEDGKEVKKQVMVGESVKRQPAADKGQNFVDPATGKLVRVEPGGDVPKGGMTASGFSTVNAPTAQSRAMSEMARTVLEQTPDLLAQVDRLKEKIGPVAGRWNSFWVNKGGINDPDFAGLDQDLDLFASALVRTHFGARGGQGYREALKKDFSAAQSPEDLKARIQHAETWIKGYAKMNDRGTGTGQKAVDPKLKAYADQYFGGNIANAQAAIAAQRQGK